jgi:hypothetical protein
LCTKNTPLPQVQTFVCAIPRARRQHNCGFGEMVGKMLDQVWYVSLHAAVKLHYIRPSFVHDLPSHYFLHSVPTYPIIPILLLLLLFPYLTFFRRPVTLSPQPFLLFPLTHLIADSSPYSTTKHSHSVTFVLGAPFAPPNTCRTPAASTPARASLSSGRTMHSS